MSELNFKNVVTIFNKFIGRFNKKNMPKKVSDLSDSEKDKLSELLIQDFIESGGGGIVQPHESDSVDMLEIFTKRMENAHGDITLSKKQFRYCFKIANRMELSGMEANVAVDLALKYRDEMHVDVDKLVKKLCLFAKDKRKL